MRADKKSMRDAGVLSTEGLWMTFTAVHHQLYWCCLCWINSWRTGGSWGDGFAFLSLLIKTSVPLLFKQVCMASVLQSYWELQRSLLDSDSLSCYPGFFFSPPHWSVSSLFVVCEGVFVLADFCSCLYNNPIIVMPSSTWGQFYHILYYM